MEQNETIIQLVRYGQADEILNILNREVPTREIFLHHTGSSLCQFIGLAASKGSMKLIKRCNIEYGVKMKIGTEEGLHAIVGASINGHNNVIEWLLEPWIKAGRVIDGKRHSEKKQILPGWLQPALHKAIRGLHVSTVKLLVESAWADINACDNDNLRPLHVAANFIDKDNLEQILRYEEIVEILLTAGAQVNELNPFQNTTPLYDAVSLDSHKATKRLIDNGADVFIPCTETKTTVLHKAAAAGFQETLRTMLDHYKLSEIDPCDFDVKDKDEITPLHAAAYGGHLECVRILIEKGLSLANMNSAGETVVDAIFKRVPNPIDFLTNILDKQVSFADKSYNKVNLNFQIITARPSAQYKERRVKSISDLDVVFALIKSVTNMDQLAILQHPLLMTFIQKKYFRSKYLTFLLFVCEVFCGIFLIIRGSCMTSLTSMCFIKLSVAIVTLLIFIILLLSVLDVVGHYLETNSRTVYFRHESISRTQTVILLLRILIAIKIVVIINISHCPSPLCELAKPMGLSIIALAILLFWVIILLDCRQFPAVQDYINMFGTVMMSILKLLGIFACLIIGFTFSFLVLLSHMDAFNTPWKAIVKTLVMMTGEYDYDDILHLTKINNSTSDKNNNTVQLVASEIVFLLFLLFISIVLMNLMVGLAVSDVEKLLRNSRSLRLMNQAKAVTQWRGLRFLFSSLLRSLGWKTTKATHTTTVVDLTSSSRVPWREIPADVKRALHDLALKNSLRDKRPQPESPRENIQETLATIQSSLATLQSSIEKIIVEQQQQNFQMVAGRSQDQMTTMKLVDSINAH